MLRLLLVAGSVAWAALLPAATFVASRPPHAGLDVLAAAAVYLAGGVVCHQLDARSFHLFGKQMPVCARCLGIYVGAAIAALAVALSGWSGRRATGARARWTLAAASAPALASLVFEWTTGVMPSNVTRAATGIVFGAVCAALVVSELKQVN